MNRLYIVILNTITLAGTLFINYYSSAGLLNGTTVADVSHKYDTLFAPADYTFGIWGWIYLWLIAFVAHQWYLWSQKGKRVPKDKDTGLWFAATNLLNAGWIVAWVYRELALSVVLMIALLASLLVLMYRLRLEVYDACVRDIIFRWWPIAFYLGWIIVATVSNIAAYLVSIGWQGGPLSPVTWTIIMIAVATLLYLLLIKTRNLREAAIVGVWGLTGITVEQWDTHPSIAYTAIGASIVLFIATAYHGLQNQHTAPPQKMKRGEWHDNT